MSWGGPIPAPTLVRTPTMPNKYRIMVFDTTHNLVAVFNNVRAFSFTDAVNGGSAAGWFRISTDTTTLLAGDTSGGSNSPGRRAQQYGKMYLSGLQQLQFNIQCDGVSTYTINLTGPAGQVLQQIVTVTIDNYYRIPITISDPGTTPLPMANIAIQIANGINKFFNNYPGPQPYKASSFTTQVLVTGANVQQQPDGNYYGVQMAAGYAVPGTGPTGQAGVYQQAFQYNYRVQFYLEDSINPWYDGRINGWTPAIPDSSTDDSYITVYTEGWQNALNDGIVTETISPGIQSNGVNNGVLVADTYLKHLLSTYKNNAIFKQSYIASVNFDLFPMQFQGEGLGQCINDVVTQVVNQSGHTFEWWVRGLWGVGQSVEHTVGVVIQPNADPMITSNPWMRIAPTNKPIKRYFVYEVRGQTIFNYQVQNTIINLYNMIALYGGRDPTTQLQVYGAYEDALSIALYGVRQQRVTNDVLLNNQTLQNYATAYLLLNGYPQPQTTYYKYKPTDAMRAGVWVQVLEQGDGTQIGQVLHQMRAISVECALQEDQEKMDQIVTAAAPHPFIDKAYYGAIQQSKSTIPIVIDRGGTINPNTYLVSGADWNDTYPHQDMVKHPNQKVNKAIITPPLGHFGSAKHAPDGNPPGPNNPNGYQLPMHLSISAPRGAPYSDQQAYPPPGTLTVDLHDTNTGKGGDGAYEVDFVTDIQKFAPGYNNGQHGQDVLVTAIAGPRSIGGYSLPSGNTGETPQSPDMLRLWQFVVLNGAIAGAVDMRTYRGQYAGAPKEASSIMLTVPRGPHGMSNAHFVYQDENTKQLPNDWYGGFQMGYKSSTKEPITGPVYQVILWFCQPGAPTLNLPQYYSGNPPKVTFQPKIYNGDMGFFSSLSGTCTQIPQPDWAKKNNWYPAEQKSIKMLNQPVPISFLTQPKWEHIPKTPMGPLGSGNGMLNQNWHNQNSKGGGIFMNWDFPGGVGALITIGVPRLELPITLVSGYPYGALLFYEIELQVACTNGNVITTTRQFTVHNAGNGSVT